MSIGTDGRRFSISYRQDTLASCAYGRQVGRQPCSVTEGGMDRAGLVSPGCVNTDAGATRQCRPCAAQER